MRCLRAQVWCSSSKRAVLRLLDLPTEHMQLLVDDPREAAVHVTGWGLRPEDLQASLAWIWARPGAWGGMQRTHACMHACWHLQHDIQLSNK